MIKRLFAPLTAAFVLLSSVALAADKPVVVVSGQMKQLPASHTLQVNASGTGAASINIPHGTAPTSPNNGDCWTTTTGLFCRVSGSTVGPYGTGTGSGSVTTTGSPASGNLTKFSGVTSVTSGDLSGDVATSGTLATTIANDAVTYAKIQNVSAASKLIGRGDSGSGDPQEITLGSGLSITGTTLTASGGGGATTAQALTITSSGGASPGATFDGSVAKTIDYSTVGAAKTGVATGSGLTMATSRLLGRTTASSGGIEEISAASNLTLSGGSLSATEATAAQIQAATASKLVAADKLISAAAPQTLTDGATINWDMHAGFNAKVTIAGNRTLAAPTNPHEGLTYRLEVIQDATGSRTMTWPSAFDWGSAGTPTLSTGASKHDFIYLDCYDASTPKFRATFNKAS